MKTIYAEPVKVQIELSKNGKLMSSTTLRSRQAAVRFVQGSFPSECDSVTACVWYSIKKGFWNKFTVNSLKAFKESLNACTEEDLVKDFA